MWKCDIFHIKNWKNDSWAIVWTSFLINIYLKSNINIILQEMLDIMKSIYDMMGKYTYPTMQDDAPREHVESFFQVKVNRLKL